MALVNKLKKQMKGSQVRMGSTSSGGFVIIIIIIIIIINILFL